MSTNNIFYNQLDIDKEIHGSYESIDSEGIIVNVVSDQMASLLTILFSRINIICETTYEISDDNFHIKIIGHATFF